MLAAVDPPGGRGGAVLPAHGKLDRRRPRRQPLRHGRGPARRRWRCRATRALELLSRGAARAGRRAVAQPAQSCRLRCAAGAGRPLARPLAEPPGRALPPRHHRHLCTARRDRARCSTCRGARHRGRARRRLMRRGRVRRPISTSIHDSPDAERLGASWRAGGCGSCGARSTCSASIWPRSTCARTPTCMSATMAELVEAAGAGHGLQGAGRGRARWRCCWRELADARGRWPRRSSTIPRKRSRTGDLPRGGAMRTGATAAASVPNHIISKADGVSDILEVARAAEGGRAAAAARRRRSMSTSCRCSRRSRTCALRPAIMDRLLGAAGLSAAAGQPRRQFRK